MIVFTTVLMLVVKGDSNGDAGDDGAGWQVDPSLLQDNLCWFSYRIIGRNTANQAATCYIFIMV